MGKKIIIIPAYNESANIVKTVHNILETTENIDYVIVNDGSTDHTRQICEEHHFNLLNLPINLGIGGAVQTGYLYACRFGYDIAVQVDGDGQHDARFLNEMADYMEKNGLDMVIGSRFIEKRGFQSSVFRRLGIAHFTWLIRLLTGKTITDPTSGLRMIGRRAMELFAEDYPSDYPEPETIVKALNHGLKVGEIPVVMRERSGGVSSISPFKSVYYMVKVSIAILLECFRSKKRKSE